VFAF